MVNGWLIMANGLPEGFTLDKPAQPQGLPEGFTLDQKITPEQQEIIKQSEAKIQSLQGDLDKLNEVRNNPDALEQLFGGVEGFLAVASAPVASIASGIAGLSDAANPFAPEGAGAARQKQVEKALTFEPELPGGKQAVENTGSALEKVTDIGTGAVAVTAGGIEGAITGNPVKAALSTQRIIDQGVGETIGSQVAETTGSPFLGSIARVIPNAALLALPVKNFGKGKTAQGSAQQLATERLKQPFSKKMSEFDQSVSKLILEKSDDIGTAGVKLSVESLKSKLSDGLARVVKDKVALNVMKQGLSEKSTAIIKASNKIEKANFRKMVKIASNALRSGTSEVSHRVGEVVGNTLKNRITEVMRLNRQAGANIDKVAKSNLSKQSVDASTATNNFASSLEKMKITLDGNKLKFKGSDIEGGISGATTAQKILKLTKERLESAGSNAFKLHELKRFIDKQVKFGKEPSGAAGGAENALKSLRAEINKTLGDKFPAYRNINAKFSETKQVLDDFQKAAGTSIDFTSKFADRGLGVKMRSLTSNNLTNARLLKAMSELEDVLVKNGVKFKDRILQQAIIANDLETLFKLTPKTSLKGVATDVAIDAATGSKVQASVKAGKTLKDIVSGKSPEKAIQAIKELLKEAN